MVLRYQEQKRVRSCRREHRVGKYAHSSFILVFQKLKLLKYENLSHQATFTCSEQKLFFHLTLTQSLPFPHSNFQEIKGTGLPNQ